MPLNRFKARNHPQQQEKSAQVDFLGPADAVGDDVDDRALPAAEYAVLNRRFRFTADVAASDKNHKCPVYFTRKTDGLAQSWAQLRVYCNPPYSNIRPWIEKAWTEKQCPLIVMLLPANRTDQSWWQSLVEPFRDQEASQLRVEFMPNRIRFLKPGQVLVGPNERPPFGCCLLIWTLPSIK